MTPEPFHPTAYTAALMLQLRRRGARVAGAAAAELGTGSGVVLATLLALGARSAWGVDIEPEAVACTRALLEAQPGAGRARVEHGDLWTPFGEARFDLVATNLPQFPAREPVADDGRRPTWSSGGEDGRALVDRFLLGLPRHLAPGGLAVMTHNVFLDLARTQALLAPHGLVATVAATFSVPLSDAKRRAMNPAVHDAWLGRGLQRVGEFTFADVDIVEIAAAGHAPLD